MRFVTRSVCLAMKRGRKGGEGEEEGTGAARIASRTCPVWDGLAYDERWGILAPLIAHYPVERVTRPCPRPMLLSRLLLSSSLSFASVSSPSDPTYTRLYFAPAFFLCLSPSCPTVRSIASMTNPPLCLLIAHRPFQAKRRMGRVLQLASFSLAEVTYATGDISYQVRFHSLLSFYHGLAISAAQFASERG